MTKISVLHFSPASRPLRTPASCHFPSRLSPPVPPPTLWMHFPCIGCLSALIIIHHSCSLWQLCSKLWNWTKNNLPKVIRLFWTSSNQFNESKFTSTVSLRNSSSWRWLKIVVKWRHWSTCTWKGWRRTDASPVWRVYTISISSVSRQVWWSGLQRREEQKKSDKQSKEERSLFG